MENPETRAIREMYRTKFSSFAGLAFRILHPHIEYEHHWSVDLIGDALERCARGETRRLIINLPPRSMKSICASVAFPAWLIARRPESKVIAVAGHRGLADDHHGLTKALMLSPKYRGLFPHVRFTEKGGKIALPHGGFRAAFTPSGALTGRGADFLIIDDPQAAHEADDPAKSAALRAWYDKNVYQRLDRKADGVVILVMQRLAHDDLTAHLLAQGGWEHLCLPAIAEEDEIHSAAFGGRVLRLRGEALQPARESREELRDALLRMGAPAFMAQYQQRPYPPGQDGERGGAFHIVEDPNATREQRARSQFFFARFPESKFVLEEVFGEYSSIRPGPPLAMTEEEFEAFALEASSSVSDLDGDLP
mgnify:FL=1